MSSITLSAPHTDSPPTFEGLLSDSFSSDLYQHQTYQSNLHPDSAQGHYTMSGQHHTITSLDLPMQTPGAGPSRPAPTRTRPSRASRPTSFIKYLTLEGDEEYQESDGSGFDTDGDGDEYRAPLDDVDGIDGNGGGSEDDEFERAALHFDHDEDAGPDLNLDPAAHDLFYNPDGSSRIPTAAQIKAYKRKLNRPDFHPDGTPIKRRPASTRKHIVIRGAVDPADLRTVTVDGTSVASTSAGAAGRGGTPATPGKGAGGARSREGSRSLPPSRTEKKFKCTWEGCDKAYTKPARLREHELSHTGERPHVCPYCSQSYIRPTHLTAHLRTHMSEDAKRYVCSVEGCGKRFWTGTHARRHEELHLEPMMYICEHCPEKFHKANQLRDHVALEHMPAGTKGYPCTHPGCTSSFTVKQHLKAHEKTHDPSRYTCAHPSHETPLNFANWTSLQSHLSSAHPPTCPVAGCGKVFKHAYRLKEHMKVHDPSIAPGLGEGVSGEEAAGVGVTKAGQGRKRKRPAGDDGQSGADAGAEAGQGVDGPASTAEGATTAATAGAGAGPKGKKKKGRPSKATRMANAAAASAAAAAESATAVDPGVNPVDPGHSVGYAIPGPSASHPHPQDIPLMYSAYASPLAEQVYGDAPAPAPVHSFDAPGAFEGMYNVEEHAMAGIGASIDMDHAGVGVGLDMGRMGTINPSAISTIPSSGISTAQPVFTPYGMPTYPYMGYPTDQFDPIRKHADTDANHGAVIDPQTFTQLASSAPAQSVPDTAIQASGTDDMEPGFGSGSIRASGGGNIRHLACPVHMLTPSTTASGPGSITTGTGTGFELGGGNSVGNIPRPTTCFARFDKAYNVKRHLLADHGVDLELDVIRDLLGLSA